MRRSTLVLSLVVAAAISSSAMAQRHSRGTGQTAFGPAYNPTQSAEWRQANGNYGVYLQIMEQKALAAQEKADQAEYKAYQAQLKQAQKEQAAFEKWVKGEADKKAKGKPVDPRYQQMLDEEAQYKAAIEARAAKAAAKKNKKKSVAKPKAANPSAEKPEKPDSDKSVKTAK